MAEQHRLVGHKVLIRSGRDEGIIAYVSGSEFFENNVIILECSIQDFGTNDPIDRHARRKHYLPRDVEDLGLWPRDSNGVLIVGENE